jgi:OmcA/MtrC family decaheme c-type cytochrome
VLAVAGLCLAAVACEQPVVGARVAALAPGEGPRIAIEDAQLDLHGHVVATIQVTQDDVPLLLSEVQALDPRFTLATLTAHPVDGLRAWKSQILNGPQVAASLPTSGPGTPSAGVLTGVRQPGAETPAALLDLGDGRFRYVFVTAVTSFDPDETLRVGAWLAGAAKPSAHTSATHDFRPSGGPVEQRDTVLDANCNGCHGRLTYHGIGAGVGLCLTCHTWQAVDPDTMDPAALVTTGYSAANHPNPLELGRLVHRLHRGRQLPTLFYSSSRSNPAPALAAGNTLPTPFSVGNNTGSTGMVLGRKYSFLGGFLGSPAKPFVPGRIMQRTENQQAARTVTSGIQFPRDIRDCGVCHERAPQAYEVKSAISRRTCSGCHPDVWYQDTPALLDESHFAHTGGSQGDDTRCAGCHVQASGGSKLYAPIVELHVPIEEGLRYGNPSFEIVKVEDLRPGGHPRITFKVKDRNGPVVPTLGNPVPYWEPDGATSSFVPRKFTSFSIRMAGSTTPDYGPTTTFSIGSSASAGGDPLLLSTSANSDEYVYVFTSTVIPLNARGSWGVALEGRRQLKYGFYDPARDTILWPGTGESVSESPDNPIVYVDTATGSWPPDGTPRRKVVAYENCQRCHYRLKGHGARHQVELCLFCHTPTTTDYPNRKKVGGFVDLSQSLDGIEERTVHLKVMVHRFHTGRRTGSASLEAIAPGLIASFVFDDLWFPNDLANCTVCHTGKAFLPENVPADAPPTVANESGWVMHAGTTTAHTSGEPARPPIQAACTGCHANGATFTHVASKTHGTVETCPQCHGAKGSKSTEVVHGLLPAIGTAASATFTSIRDNVLVPRCATTACHGAGGTPPILVAASAYSALVGAPSGQSSLLQVEPFAPTRSYLVYKLRGDAAAVGGAVATIMPTDGALAPADIAAIEAWIANGAPND